MKKLILCILIVSTVATLIYAQTLTVNITGVRNTSGEISLAFFKCEKDFKSEKPAFTKIVKKSLIENGAACVKYSDIKPGTYGIALLDDENKNSKMDYKFFVPKEGFGFSDYYHTGLRKPSYSRFCFCFGDSDKTIKIKVRYM